MEYTTDTVMYAFIGDLAYSDISGKDSFTNHVFGFSVNTQLIESRPGIRGV
jgi:hypothetical protein